MWNQIRSWFKRYYWIIEKVGFYVLLVLSLGFGLIFFSLSGTDGERNIVEDWNTTISKLGIEPVFPPEEDIYVGDLLAVVVNDSHEGQKSAKERPLLNKAIKLAHVDSVHTALSKYYKGLPVFAETEDKPSDPNKAWKQKESPEGAFSPQETRKVLPIAAFPGFVIASKSFADASLLNPLNVIQISVKGKADRQLQFSSVETYGVPSIEAKKILDEYCDNNVAICDDKNIRSHLGFVSNELGDYMFDSDEHDGVKYYKVSIDLELVSRVYLTRAIIEKTENGGVESAKGKYGDGGSESSNAQAGSKGTSIQVMTGAAAKSPDVVATSSERIWDTVSGLSGVFDRPIVFGYRAVKKHLRDQVITNDPAARPAEKK
jgi:hypothetical protein